MTPDPQEFTREWIEAWNAHDLPSVLSHYTEDFEMSSPYIAQFIGEPSGMLKGKEQVAAYWAVGLQKLPDLHFELIKTYAGATSIAIHYHGAKGKTVIEVFHFAPDGRVNRAAAHYD
ncbi:MAG: nuclear transport factor 2 family protein [Burkholderiaceae bacterium]